MTGYPACLEVRVRCEFYGPFPLGLHIIGYIAAAGDPVSVGQGVQHGAEVGAFIGLEAGGEPNADAGARCTASPDATT